MARLGGRLWWGRTRVGVARVGGDSKVAMMAVAAENGGDRLRQWRTKTVTADNNSGGGQRRQMMTAPKIERWTTEEEGGEQAVNKNRVRQKADKHAPPPLSSTVGDIFNM